MAKNIVCSVCGLPSFGQFALVGDNCLDGTCPGKLVVSEIALDRRKSETLACSPFFPKPVKIKD